ncbi:hypothetical protein Bca4012_067579 [Brassica carinata]
MSIEKIDAQRRQWHCPACQGWPGDWYHLPPLLAHAQDKGQSAAKLFKNKLTKQNKHAKTLEESQGILSEKLRKTAEDNRIVRLRTKMQHEQNREELMFVMDAQDRFFSESIKQIHGIRDAKEEDFEMLQQQERAKVVVQQEQKKNTNLSIKDELRKR